MVFSSNNSDLVAIEEITIILTYYISYLILKYYRVKQTKKELGITQIFKHILAF
jgi:hypothetical protein